MVVVEIHIQIIVIIFYCCAKFSHENMFYNFAFPLFFIWFLADIITSTDNLLSWLHSLFLLARAHKFSYFNSCLAPVRSTKNKKHNTTNFFSSYHLVLVGFCSFEEWRRRLTSSQKIHFRVCGSLNFFLHVGGQPTATECFMKIKTEETKMSDTALKL